MRTLQNVGTKLFIRNPGNYIFWITFALVIKGIFFIFRLHHNTASSIPGFMGEVWGDTGGYLDPIDNLLKTGLYNSTGVYNQLDRMPGYGAPYFIFRLLFTKAMACNLLITVQVIADALSVYALALIAKNVFASNTLFYLTFYTYLVSTYTALYDNVLITESLTTAALVFSLYFFTEYSQKRALKNLLLSGFFLMWTIFLRQVYFPIILFIILFLVFDLYRTNKGLILKTLIYFTIPFIAAEGYWIARNYNTEKRFIFFIKNRNYYPGYIDSTNYRFALFDFIKSWGGDCVQWYPHAEIRWFWPNTIESGKEIIKHPKISLPDDIYTSKFTPDSLKVLRNYIAVIEYTDSSAVIKSKYNRLIAQKLNDYVLSEKSERPYIYYIRAPLKIAYNMLFNAPAVDPEHRRYNTQTHMVYLIKKTFRVFVSITYLWVIVFGIFGALYCCKGWFRVNVRGLLSVIVLYSALAYPFIFRLDENRYLVPAYPLLLLFANVFSVALFFLFFNRNKIKNNAY